MDILNWIYMKTAGLVKTTANDPNTDLIALGAEVSFTQRGDGYQTYGMTLTDAVFSGETAINTITTGVYDTYPYIITPTFSKSTAKVIDEISGATYVGYKIQGQIELDGATSYLEYLGTVTIKDGVAVPDLGLNWKSTGTVQFSQGPIITIQPLSAINSAEDTGATTTSVQISFISVPSVIGNDVLVDTFINVSPIALVPPPVGNVELIVSFELETLVLEGLNLSFTV